MPTPSDPDLLCFLGFCMETLMWLVFLLKNPIKEGSLAVQSSPAFCLSGQGKGGTPASSQPHRCWQNQKAQDRFLHQGLWDHKVLHLSEPQFPSIAYGS